MPSLYDVHGLRVVGCHARGAFFAAPMHVPRH
jgi:hypothetical protein